MSGLGTGWGLRIADCGLRIGGKLFARTETHGNMEVELVFDPREQPTHNGRLDGPRDETVRCLWDWLIVSGEGGRSVIDGYDCDYHHM